MTIKAFDFVLEFCKVILVKIEKGAPYSSIKEIAILELRLHDVMGNFIKCLATSYHDSSEDIAIREFNTQKCYLATLIMSYLCKIYKFSAASLLVPLIGNSSTPESDPESRGISFTALTCALHCGELDKYLDESLRSLLPLTLQAITEPQMSRYYHYIPKAFLLLPRD